MQWREFGSRTAAAGETARNLITGAGSWKAVRRQIRQTRFRHHAGSWKRLQKQEVIGMEFSTGKVRSKHHLRETAGHSGKYTTCEIQPGCRSSAVPISYGSRLESLKEETRNSTMRPNGNCAVKRNQNRAPTTVSGRAGHSIRPAFTLLHAAAGTSLSGAG
jgi:hypothetical protein